MPETEDSVLKALVARGRRVPMTVTIPVHHLEQVDAAAARIGCTRSAVIQELVSRFIRDEVKA